MIRIIRDYLINAAFVHGSAGPDAHGRWALTCDLCGATTTISSAPEEWAAAQRHHVNDHHPIAAWWVRTRHV